MLGKLIGTFILLFIYISNYSQVIHAAKFYGKMKHSSLQTRQMPEESEHSCLSESVDEYDPLVSKSNAARMNLEENNEESENETREEESENETSEDESGNGTNEEKLEKDANIHRKSLLNSRTNNYG